jgi:hypothetical protein
MKKKIRNLEKTKTSYSVALFLLASSSSSNLLASAPACQAAWKWGDALEPAQHIVTMHMQRPVQKGKKLRAEIIEAPAATAKAAGGGAVATARAGGGGAAAVAGKGKKQAVAAAGGGAAAAAGGKKSKK